MRRQGAGKRLNDDHTLYVLINVLLYNSHILFSMTFYANRVRKDFWKKTLNTTFSGIFCRFSWDADIPRCGFNWNSTVLIYLDNALYRIEIHGISDFQNDVCLWQY